MSMFWISVSAFEKLHEEAQRKHPLETGGLLMGYVVGTDVVVTDVIGPGPNAVHQSWNFEPDYEYHRAEAERVWEASGKATTYVGDWHTHPNGLAIMSELDHAALRKIGDNINNPVMLIHGLTIAAFQLVDGKTEEMISGIYNPKS